MRQFRARRPFETVHMLDISEDYTGDVAVLGLGGRLDALTAPELRPLIDKLIAEHRQHVIFDLKELETVDSSGVGAIVSLFKRLRMIGGDLKIARLTGQPKEIFRLLRLDRAFDLFDTVEAALKKIKR